MGILLTDVHGDNLQCRISVSFEASSAVFALELNASINLLNCKNTERPSYNPWHIGNLPTQKSWLATRALIAILASN